MNLDEIERLASEATPGPWRWGGHDNSYSGVQLESLASHRPIVMGFQRRGMRSAEPVFWDRQDGNPCGVFRSARDIVVREVEYREDVVALDNADARFIADISPDVVLALVETIRTQRATNAALAARLSL